MELRRERRDIGDVNPCIATTKSVTSQLASAAHTCRLPLSPIAHHARYQIGQPLEAFREAFAPRGEPTRKCTGIAKQSPGAPAPGARRRARLPRRRRVNSPRKSATGTPSFRRPAAPNRKRRGTARRSHPAAPGWGRDLARAGKNLLALQHGYRRERFPIDVFDTVKYERASRQLDIRLRAPPTSPCAVRPGRAPSKNRSPPWHEEAALRRPQSVHNKSGDNLIHDELDAAAGEEVMQ